MLTGMLLGVLFYRPIFNIFLKDTDVKEWITGTDPMKKVKRLLAKRSLKLIRFKCNQDDQQVITHTKTKWILSNGMRSQKAGQIHLRTAMQVSAPVWQRILKPGYADKILPAGLKWKFIFLVWVMIIFVTMVYGPVAAFLVELFPTKIRYTSMSLPYHIGNGVFGGLVPFIATLLSATFIKDPLVGLWYPIGVAAFVL